MSNATITNEEVKAAQSGNPDAAERILSDMHPILCKLANKISGRYNVEEAISEGRVAVWEAILSFDPDRNTAFITHAYGMARTAMLHFISANNPGPTIPWRTVQRYQRVMQLANGDYEAALLLIRGGDAEELGSEGTFATVHRALGEDIKHLDFIRNASDLDEEDRDVADSTVDVEEAALNRVVVDALLAECNEREVLIMSMTYGIGGHTEMKDQDIADAIGISRPRVVTIRKAALARLAASNTELAGVI